MGVIVERVAGLDVHQKTVMAAVRTPGSGRRRRQEIYLLRGQLFRTLSVQSSGTRGSDMAKTARIEVRTDPEREALLKEAASLTDQTLTGFILDAASRRAEEVITQANTTVVPSAFFDTLLDALDKPPTASAALQKAARRLDQLVEQR